EAAPGVGQRAAARQAPGLAAPRGHHVEIAADLAEEAALGLGEDHPAAVGAVHRVEAAGVGPAGPGQRGGGAAGPAVPRHGRDLEAPLGAVQGLAARGAHEGQGLPVGAEGGHVLDVLGVARAGHGPGLAGAQVQRVDVAAGHEHLGLRADGLLDPGVREPVGVGRVADGQVGVRGLGQHAALRQLEHGEE
ncbi:MAG: hypothetical protein ACK55I_40460, partial [bacterium]